MFYYFYWCYFLLYPVTFQDIKWLKNGILGGEILIYRVRNSSNNHWKIDAYYSLPTVLRLQWLGTATVKIFNLCP